MSRRLCYLVNDGKRIVQDPLLSLNTANPSYMGLPPSGT